MTRVHRVTRVIDSDDVHSGRPSRGRRSSLPGRWCSCARARSSGGDGLKVVLVAQANRWCNCTALHVDDAMTNPGTVKKSLTASLASPRMRRVDAGSRSFTSILEPARRSETSDPSRRLLARLASINRSRTPLEDSRITSGRGRSPLARMRKHATMSFGEISALSVQAISIATVFRFSEGSSLTPNRISSELSLTRSWASSLASSCDSVFEEREGNSWRARIAYPA